MIRTKDLMLGNYVYPLLAGDKKAIPMYVVGIFEDVVHLGFYGTESNNQYEFDEKELDGIPVTKELLEQIMRRHYVINGCGFSDDRVIITINNGCASMQKKYTRGEINDIRYLHQLQNAYFILTGERLDVKLC